MIVGEMERGEDMKGHGFWSCLLLVSCIMCIVTGHQIISER